MKIFFKRFIIIIIFIFLMNVNFTCISALAITKTVDVTINYDKVIVNKGGTFNLKIGLNNFAGVVKGIQAAKFVIHYDSDNFDCSISPTLGKIDMNELTITKSFNKVVIVYLDGSPGETPIVDEGTIIEVLFMVRPSALNGDYSFIIDTGNTEFFVDCDVSTLVNQRSIFPSLSAHSTQNIKIEENKNLQSNISSISSPIKYSSLGYTIVFVTIGVFLLLFLIIFFFKRKKPAKQGQKERED